MSSLFGMIYKGVSGLNAAQVALDTVGQNITNMKNMNYSRQVVSIVTSKPQYTYVGQIGTGVKVAGINRSYDDLLAKSVRNEASSYSYFSTMSSTLKEAMLYFNELEQGSGLGDALKNYFNSWSDLANTAPDKTDEAIIKRNVLVEKAETLAGKIREGYQSIEDVRSKADTTIRMNVESINQISKNIAQLNQEITKAEVGGFQANDLRDSRDALVDKLSEMVNVTTSERPNGQMTIFIGGQPIVDGTTAHILEATPNNANNGHLDVMWKTDNIYSEPIKMNSIITGGSTAAVIKTRDETLVKYEKELDNLASTLIEETNRVHAGGQGLTRPAQVTSSQGVINPTYPLGSDIGNFPYKIENGTFRITLYDQEGKQAAVYDIDVDPEQDNLLSIIDKISRADGGSVGSGGMIEAYLSDDNGIQISAGTGYTLSFSGDTSNFLVAAGINGFFSGSSAKDIDLSTLIKDNPNYIATSKTGAAGDNTNALELSKIQFKTLEGNDKLTIGQFYGVLIGTMGSDKSQADVSAATKKMAFGQLHGQLQSIRGVSEQEELINLSLFQRTFEANSRFINVVDEMLNTIINGLGVGGR